MIYSMETIFQQMSLYSFTSEKYGSQIGSIPYVRSSLPFSNSGPLMKNEKKSLYQLLPIYKHVDKVGWWSAAYPLKGTTG